MAPETRSESEAVPESSEEERPAEESATPARERSTEDPEDRLADLEERCEELNAKWLRAQADFQNLRRRSLDEVQSSLKRHMQPLLDELLLVLDYLDMALASPTESDDARNLAMGVQMTRDKLVQALEASDVKEIEAEGLFDPAQHEAVEARPAGDAAPGTILEVARRGYTWQDRVLRPTRVIVAADEEDVGAGDPGDDDERAEA